MLGRLARYLRILGYDTEYVRGLSDEQIVDRLGTAGRVLITRDRALGSRVPGSILLNSVELPDQLRELKGIRPELHTSPRFDRCTGCNGELEGPRSAGSDTGSGEPGSDDRPRWTCRECGHRYWEGSHTARLRDDLRKWLGVPT